MRMIACAHLNGLRRATRAARSARRGRRREGSRDRSARVRASASVMASAPNVFVEILASLGPRNRHDVVALRQHPRERQLRRRAAMLRRDALISSTSRRLCWKFSPWNRGDVRR